MAVLHSHESTHKINRCLGVVPVLSIGAETEGEEEMGQTLKH